LARLLETYRGVRNERNLPPLSAEQIVLWAKAYHSRHDEWPTYNSGPIHASGGETWLAVNSALNRGGRGLTAGSSLAKLLAERGLKRNQKSLPELTYTHILQWADRHHAETGQWPKNTSGMIQHTRGEKWVNVDRAMRMGLRGLPGGSSLAQLLAARRGIRNQSSLPELTVEQILEWADSYHARTGEWPKERSGAIVEAPGETWKRVEGSLRAGHRGLPADFSLARVLAEQRGVPNKQARPRLELEQILAWAEAYRQRHGKWPSGVSGAIPEAPGETWSRVDGALRAGQRGLRGGTSLSRLLKGQGM
jgi:hypothetical protein